MGLADVPAISDYWSHNDFFGQDFMKNSGMSRIRFQDIFGALHLCDIQEDEENQRKNASGQHYGPLLKVKPFMNELQEACQSAYYPGQSVSIDDRMIRSKGRFDMKQYLIDNYCIISSNAVCRCNYYNFIIIIIIIIITIIITDLYRNPLCFLCIVSANAVSKISQNRLA